MADQIDVYRDWLGIKETVRPLGYYALLRLNRFEDDPVRVRTHYRKLNAHVRKYAGGDFAKESQDLLNEIARAMLCLTDARRKSEYDASLGREQPGDERRRSIEEILLLRKVIDRDQLEKARRYADAVGLDIHDALIQQKLVKPEIVMQVYAESLGLPYVDLADIGVDRELVPKVPATLARKHSFAPVMVDDGQVLLASPKPIGPDVEEELRLRLGMPVRSVICTTAGIDKIVGVYFSKEAAAAEMAGATAAPVAAEGAKAGKKAGSGGGAARGESLKIAAIAFNFAFMAGMFWQMLMVKPTPGFLASVPMALVFGVPAGVIAYFVVGMRNR